MLAFLLLPLDSRMALYAVLVAMLVFSTLGLPVPEEVTLLIGGYLAYLEFIGFWTTIYVLIIGILVADTVGYALGYFIGDWLYAKISRFVVVSSLLARARRLFGKYGEKVMLFSRPLLGVRVVVPIMAGHFRMNFGKFLLFDTIAAIPWAILLVSLSYYLGSGLDLITKVREIKHIFFVLLWIAIVIYAARFIGRKDVRV